jgi:hypothetical protein
MPQTAGQSGAQLLCMIAWNPICLLWNQLEWPLVSTPRYDFSLLNPVNQKVYWDCNRGILGLCSGMVMEGVCLWAGLKTFCHSYVMRLQEKKELP